MSLVIMFLLSLKLNELYVVKKSISQWAYLTLLQELVRQISLISTHPKAKQIVVKQSSSQCAL